MAEELPPTSRAKSPDPDDDYLIALARSSHSVLVSVDGDLLGLSDQIPVYSSPANSWY
jgi:predicted nucleic acid-binding protein